jgi:hypothetical protein
MKPAIPLLGEFILKPHTLIEITYLQIMKKLMQNVCGTRLLNLWQSALVWPQKI